MRNAANDELRVRILDEAAKLFNEKGIRFTMDDLARSLAMSKKTIYTVFEDKRSIMTETIDRFFDDALTAEEMILNDDSLSLPLRSWKLFNPFPFPDDEILPLSKK